MLDSLALGTPFHEIARQTRTPQLRAEVATFSQGTGSRNEAGRTVVRHPREESQFHHSKEASRQSRW